MIKNGCGKISGGISGLTVFMVVGAFLGACGSELRAYEETLSRDGVAEAKSAQSGVHSEDVPTKTQCKKPRNVPSVESCTVDPASNNVKILFRNVDVPQNVVIKAYINGELDNFVFSNNGVQTIGPRNRAVTLRFIGLPGKSSSEDKVDILLSYPNSSSKSQTVEVRLNKSI